MRTLRAFFVATSFLFTVASEARTEAISGAAARSRKPARATRSKKPEVKPGAGYVRLSPNAHMRWPAALGEQPVYLVTLDAFVSEANKKQPYAVLIKRDKPLGMANEFSAARLWRSSVLGSADLFKKNTDRGCRRVSSRVYTCERLAVNNLDEWVAERITWSNDKDLVYLRLSAPKSQKSPVSLMAEMDVWVPPTLRGKP